MKLCPVETFTTSTKVLRSSPKRFAASIASEVATKEVAATRLFNALVACPAPTPPVSKSCPPMASSKGRAAARTASSSAPIMIASVPSLARGTPPETGASISVTFFSVKSLASACVPVGSAELMSITTQPGFALLIKAPPSVFISTSLTTCPSGSMVITKSITPSSARLAAERAPLSTLKLSDRALSRSKTVRS